ncbi:MAG TPA: tetratricopeptide repeat protein [Gemmatimonadales bacterium]|nr:tetratricopeptide repeat protein [Gemmatimonadales bacterium]
MRTTASYDLFPDAPSERAMARARWLAQQGRIAEAERAYRGVLAAQPDLKACWAECFELLRSHDRREDALRLAEAALGHFGPAAFPLALQGAGLIELGRFRDALGALEQAIERDPELGLAWHELGYAAYRLGDRNRALLALDRAFALEPHTETLQLRGRVLRDAGRYQAAEVAFEAAAQTGEHDEQRAGAEREILATRRYAGFAPRRPEDLNTAERWFADTGTIVLAPDPGPVAPSDEALIKAFAEVATDAGWRFGQVIALGPTLGAWRALAEALRAPLAPRDDLDVAACPLVVAPRPLPAEPAWETLTQTLGREAAGLALVLEHPVETPPGASSGADVIGVLTDQGVRRPSMPNTARALTDAQVPAARTAGRRLRPA